jgi:hypothetical protein
LADGVGIRSAYGVVILLLIGIFSICQVAWRVQQPVMKSDNLL